MRRTAYALVCGAIVAGVLSALSGSNGAGGGIVASGGLVVFAAVAAVAWGIMAAAGIARPHRRRPLVMPPVTATPLPGEEEPEGFEPGAWYEHDELPVPYVPEGGWGQYGGPQDGVRR